MGLRAMPHFGMTALGAHDDECPVCRRYRADILFFDWSVAEGRIFQTLFPALVQRNYQRVLLDNHLLRWKRKGLSQPWKHNPELDCVPASALLPGGYLHWQTQEGDFLFLPVGLDPNHTTPHI